MLNGLDIFILLVVVGAAFRGYKTGLITQLTSLIGLFLALWIAYSFSSDLAPILRNWFSLFDPNSSLWMKLLPMETIELMIYRAFAFLLLFFGVKIFVWLLGKVLAYMFEFPIIKQVNKYGGVLFATIQILLVAFVLICIVDYLPFANSEKTLQESFIAQGVLSIRPEITEALLR